MTIHLSIVVFWAVAVALLLPLASDRLAPLFTLLGTLVPLFFGVALLFGFDNSPTADPLQYVTNKTWIPELGVHYKLGIDGLNLWLVALTTVLFAATALWLIFRPVERPRLFGFHLALAEAGVLGALVAQDLALFVFFFDLMLIPFYFLVGQWGGERRISAAIKMVVYTLVGSLLMLAGAVATAVLVSQQNKQPISFLFTDLVNNNLSASTQGWIFVAFALAFLIKMPAFPFHGWMPDAYRNMPLPVLIVFSGVLSKVAAYGFLRIALPIFPDASVDFQMIILILALLSIIYGSLQAFTQTNARLILGYSSIAQLGFITLGIFAFQGQGAQGAILQMVNHGLVVAPVFFIVILLAERANGSESIRDLGGMAFRAPVLATLFIISALAMLAMPGSANFVSEFLILLGLFNSKLWIAVTAFLGVVFASVYMLRMLIRSIHNRPGPDVKSREITVADGLVLVPLILLIIAFGLYPQEALRDGQRSAAEAVARPAAVVSKQEAAAQRQAAANTRKAGER